jgi:PAS domain S-box-containing protein
MNGASFLAFLQNARLVAYALSPSAAWVWARDGGELLWANAAGAAALGCHSARELTDRRFDASHPLIRDLKNLSPRLPTSGATQLARLRGLSEQPGAMTLCACSRLLAENETDAILVVATGPVKRPLALDQRVLGLVRDLSAVAVYGAGGALLHAASDLTGTEAVNSAMLALIDEARSAGDAAGLVGSYRVKVQQVPAYDGVLLLATFEDLGILERARGHVSQGAAAPDAQSSPTREGARDAAWYVFRDDAEKRLLQLRRPLRFVWRMDAEGRFSIDAGDFTSLAGVPTQARVGQLWDEFAGALDVDPDAKVTQAIASRQAWSAIAIDWPMEGTDVRLPVTLSGLPLFSAGQQFAGYRGFGVCRDVERLRAVLAAMREALTQRPAVAPGTEIAPVPAPDSREQAADPHSIETAPADGEQPGPAAPLPAFPEVLAASEEPHPLLRIVPTAQNVVPLRASMSLERRPHLTPVEHTAFHEIARALGARLEGEGGFAGQRPASAPAAYTSRAAEPLSSGRAPESRPGPIERMVLDRLPVGAILYQGRRVLLANRTLLDWTGFQCQEQLEAAGGADFLLGAYSPAGRDTSAGGVTIRTASGAQLSADTRLFKLEAEGDSALLLVLTRRAEERGESQVPGADAAQAHELKSILDTATDGVLVLDDIGTVIEANQSAQALFGYDSREIAGRSFVELFAPETQRLVREYLNSLAGDGVARVLNDGREVIGRVRSGGLIPLFMTLGRIAESPPKFCAVFRDITALKKAEEELSALRREAQQAHAARSDAFARIVQTTRTPMNAIIASTEAMLGERYGPIGNPRYLSYLKDIHAWGEGVVILLNDLFDLSRIEAGKLELSPVSFDLNDLVQQCVAIMQPHANGERIIIRTALSSGLPPVIADAGSARQIVLNLMSASIRSTAAGGQVIVSTTALSPAEVALRVRDTGVGMTEQEIENALEPFRHGGAAQGGDGVVSPLGLPLTKALAEANRGRFHIKSAKNAGTLTEIVFPAASAAA